MNENMLSLGANRMAGWWVYGEEVNALAMKYIPVILVLLGLAACDFGGPEPEWCKGGECTYQYYENSQVRVRREYDDALEDSVIINVGGDNGDMLVFLFEYVKKDRPNVQDDELTRQFWFEVDPDVEAFTYTTDEALSAANAYVARYCFCSWPFGWPAQGKLIGNKLDDTSWEICGDLTYDLGYGQGTETFSFERVFTKF